MLGEVLRAEREKQGLTITDIENGTSIRALYITSIEEGNYDVIPGEVYLKGFIKNYANFLKLDGAAMVKRYNEEKPSSEPEPTDETATPSPSGDAVKPPVSTQIKQRRQLQNVSMLLISLLVLAALAVAGYYLFVGKSDASRGDDSAAKVAASEQAVSSRGAAAGQAQRSPEVVQPEIPAAKTAKVTVMAQFTDRCWLQVRDDQNKIIYEQIADRGTSLTWQADKSLVLYIGNLGAVEIEHNNKRLGKLGKSGEVEEFIFTVDSYSKLR